MGGAAEAPVDAPAPEGFAADAAPAAPEPLMAENGVPSTDEFGAAGGFAAEPAAADGFGDAADTGFGDAPAEVPAPDGDNPVDYYTSEAVSMMPEVPMPGYFAPDGAYVPPTGVQEEVVELDTAALQEWEAAHQSKIQEIDAKERAEMSERQAAAEKEIAEFEASRQKRIAMVKTENQTLEG